MKQCRFCLENIHESAEACSHCGNWQPSPEEINFAYKEVAARMARNKMEYIRVVPFLFLFVIVILSLLRFDSDVSQTKSSLDKALISLSFLTLVLFLVRDNMFRQYLDKTIFEEAVTIDQLLHKRLKELQIRKSQSYTRMLVIVVCTLILLLIFSNAKILGNFFP